MMERLRMMMRKLFKRRSGRNTEDTPPPNGPTTPESTAPLPPLELFPSGIKLLHDPTETVLVDVVFVHGLTGHREKTWTAPGETEPWPKSLLPAKISNARVLTFGYDASVADWRSMVSEGRVGNHAQNLLNALANFREDNDTNARPIIFACHSLGGLVCEDALVSSRQRPERHLKAILAATKGVIFLGTPHHGSGLAIWAQRFAMYIGLLKQTNTNIVGVLRANSEVLARIQDSFHTMIQSRIKENQAAIEITCFYEELALPGIGLVVPQDSAILPGYIPIGIRNDHQGMTKFASLEDAGFVAVCAEIQRWIREIEKSGTALKKTSETQEELLEQPMVLQSVPHSPLGHFVVPFAPNPDFVGRSDILELLEDKFAFKNNPRQIKGRPRLSLYGLGGVGKTQIALAYVCWLRESQPDISVFWVHAGSKERLQQAFSNIAEECDIPGRMDSSVDILALVKDWLKKRSSRWFLVLDNADDLDVFFPGRDEQHDSISEFGTGHQDEIVTTLIPESNVGAVLITTRNKQIANRLAYPQRPIAVEKMCPNESVEMIRLMSGDSEISFEKASILADRLENLPLALAQAATFMLENSMGIDRYTEILDKSDDAIIRLFSEQFVPPEGDYAFPHAVMLTWITSFEQIQQQNPLAADLLSTTAFLDRQDIPRELLLMNLVSRGQITCDKPFWRQPVSDNEYEKYVMKLENTAPSDEHQATVRVDLKGNLQIKLPSDDLPHTSRRSKASKGERKVARRMNSSTQRKYGNDSLESFFKAKQSLLLKPSPFSGIILADTTRQYEPRPNLPEDLQNLRPISSPLRNSLEPDETSIVAFEKALGILKAFSIIWESKNGSVEIHRLVQIAMKEWLKRKEKPRYFRFSRIALRALVEAFPDKDYEDMDICLRLLPHAHAVLKSIQALRTPTTIPNALLSEAVGRFYINIGQTKIAGELLQHAFESSAKALGESDPLSLRIMRILAICYTDQGRSRDASKLLERLISNEERVHSESNPQRLKSMSALAGHRHMVEKYDEAEALLAKAIELCDIRADGSDQKIDLEIQMLGVLISAGKIEEAEKVCTDVVQTLRNHSYGGVGRLLLLRANLAQAMISKEKGQLNQAEELCRSSLKGLDPTSDDARLYLLAVMDVLGSVLYQQKKLDEAGEIQAQVVESIFRMKGLLHPKSLSAIESLATTRKEQGRLQEAHDLEAKAEEICNTAIRSDYKLRIEVSSIYHRIRYGRAPRGVRGVER